MASRCRRRAAAVARARELARSLLNPLNPFSLFGLLVFGALLRALLGRLLGSAATGGVVGVLAWFVLGSLAAGVARSA